MRSLHIGSLFVFLACVSCGGNQTDAKTADNTSGANATPSASSAPASTAQSAASTTSASSATTAAPAATDVPNPAAKRPLDILSECADVVHIVYGDDPKGTARSSIAQGGTIEAPRRPDGTQVVNLLDDHDEPIAKVTITKHMKHVVVGRSCRTMDAH
jgi:hypothetical protein